MKVQLRNGDEIELRDYVTQDTIERVSEALQFSVDVGPAIVTDDDVLTELGADGFAKYLESPLQEKEGIRENLASKKAKANVHGKLTLAQANRANRELLLGMILCVRYRESIPALEAKYLSREDLNAYLGNLPSRDYMALVETCGKLRDADEKRGKG